MKKWAVSLVAVLLMLCGAALAEELHIVTTSFPCYDFVRQVAGDKAEVTMLIRPGTEVHSFEPSPADILSVGEADLFFCIGGESDAWIGDMLDSFGGSGPVSVRLIESIDETVAAEHDHDHEHEYGHGEIVWDEHIWTSPKNAVPMVRMVQAALSEAAPEAADVFASNADAYVEEIEEINRSLTALLENSARKKVVFADRFPFLYLARDYGIEYEAAFSSCASDTEPSAMVMVQLIQTIVQERIPAVYIIEMSTGTIARTISEETGAEVLTLHSAQTVTQQEFDAGETYVSLMKRNLVALEKGLN